MGGDGGGCDDDGSDGRDGDDGDDSGGVCCVMFVRGVDVDVDGGGVGVLLLVCVGSNVVVSNEYVRRMKDPLLLGNSLAWGN